MSKFGALIKEARKTEDQKTRKKDERHPRGAAEEEKQVNLGVKVPISLRRHWAAESKRRGVSMTSVIIEALTEKFGKPE